MSGASNGWIGFEGEKAVPYRKDAKFTKKPEMSNKRFVVTFRLRRVSVSSYRLS